MKYTMISCPSANIEHALCTKTMLVLQMPHWQPEVHLSVSQILPWSCWNASLSFSPSQGKRASSKMNCEGEELSFKILQAELLGSREETCL